MSEMSPEEIQRNFGHSRTGADWSFPRPGVAVDKLEVHLALSEDEIRARDSLRAREYAGLSGLRKRIGYKVVGIKFPPQYMIDEEVERVRALGAAE